MEAFHVLERRKKISGIYPEAIVAILHLEIDQSSRSLAELCRIPAAAYINLAQGIRIHAHSQRTGGRLAYLKAIQIVLYLLRARSGNVDLPTVTHHAWNVRQHVAIVTRCGIRNIGDVTGGDGLRR